MAKDAFWFKHDSNAKDDPKIMLLIDQLQLEGYGIYWVLIEILRDQPNYSYPLNLLPALARRYNTSHEKMRAVVLNYGLFSVYNDEVFFSESLCRRMIDYDEKKQKASMAANIRWEKQKALLFDKPKELVEKTRIVEAEIVEVKQCTGNADAYADVLQEQCTPNAIREDKIRLDKIRLDKNRKDKKKDIVYFESENLNDMFLAFIEMRKKIKDPLTDRGIELAIKKLNKIADNEEEKIAILEESIINNWKGLFELKKGVNTYGKGKNNSGDNSGNTKQGGSKYDDLGIFG